jgi:deazaflavin-dependent oxidoreductase (nitroreductase family)
MHFHDGSSLIAHVTTVGRKSGVPRTVELRLLYAAGNFYATSSRIQGKHWCQNMINNPAVEITTPGEKLPCRAQRITDEALRQRILRLRDTPPELDRVVFEIVPRIRSGTF